MNATSKTLVDVLINYKLIVILTYSNEVSFYK